VDVLGGAATYSCCAAAHFAPVALIGVVGNDFPVEHMELLRSCRINTEGLQVAEGKTFRWSCSYHPDMMGRDTLSTELGVFETYSPEIPEHLRKTPYVLLGNIHPDLQRHVLDQIEDPKLVAADTMNLWIDTAKESLDKLINRVDLLFLNDDEARMLTGEANLTVAADRIHEMGPDIVMVKRGEHGSSLHFNGEVDFIPPYPARSVFDPTGAGDSFAGGMVGRLALSGEINRRTLREAAFYGTVMASFSIEEFGPEHVARVSGTEMSERLGAIQWTLGGN
jgi:sugar/nucleoside kinase (ribokinase family)